MTKVPDVYINLTCFPTLQLLNKLTVKWMMTRTELANCFWKRNNNNWFWFETNWIEKTRKKVRPRFVWWYWNIFRYLLCLQTLSQEFINRRRGRYIARRWRRLLSTVYGSVQTSPSRVFVSSFAHTTHTIYIWTECGIDFRVNRSGKHNSSAMVFINKLRLKSAARLATGSCEFRETQHYFPLSPPRQAVYNG